MYSKSEPGAAERAECDARRRDPRELEINIEIPPVTAERMREIKAKLDRSLLATAHHTPEPTPLDPVLSAQLPPPPDPLPNGANLGLSGSLPREWSLAVENSRPPEYLTPASFVSLTRRCELRQFPFPVTVEAEVIPDWTMVLMYGNDDAGGVRLTVSIRVAERDTGLEVMLSRSHTFWAAQVATMSENQVYEIVRRAILDAVLHEFDECWYVGGERVRDPHCASVRGVVTI